jgi:SAM-dependent methyltransferase
VFEVAADAYDRFMGRYSTPLAPRMADFAGVGHQGTALDVGCGPGALTAELARRLGPTSVTAVDPSQSFVEAVRSRVPGVHGARASAEDLPFENDSFDIALAQLVVHFMADPVAGLREMARVTRRGGTVAACVWYLGGRSGPLSAFWRAVRAMDPDADDESGRAGTHEGQLVALLGQAGLNDVEGGVLEVRVEHATFADWWEPYTRGVGPAGAYVARLTDHQRDALRDRCQQMLGAEPVVVVARAWAAKGYVR